MIKYFPKANDFILKKDENGTTIIFKKTPLILKDFFGKKSLISTNQWLSDNKVTYMG
jgi:hypothetical protein